MNISSKGDDTSTIGGSLNHHVQGDHVIASHDALHFSVHKQVTFQAGSATITMTPNQITIDTPTMRSSVGGPTTTLPAIVPTYLPPKGTIAQQGADQSGQDQQDVEKLFYPSAKLSIDLGEMTLPPEPRRLFTYMVSLSLKANLAADSDHSMTEIEFNKINRS